MKTIVIHVVLQLVCLAALVRADDIYTMIQRGQLREATDSLSKLATASARDGDVLFFQSLLEPAADRSAQLMEAALAGSVSLTYRQEVYYRLAQYYLLKNDMSALSRIVNEYRARWETGRYEKEMARFSIIADQMSGDNESALKQADRYLVRYTSGDDIQWGTVDKARILIANDKGIGASKLLRTLSRERSGDGVPMALYLLGQDAIDKKRTEDAVFYYNLLREGYPLAIGLDALVGRLSGISGSYGGDNTADRITGTYYSVKVGVFAEKSNARKQADIFKDYDRQVDIREKDISGKKYHVVYVGRFSSYEDAHQFKITLESRHGELYQVVAR